MYNNFGGQEFQDFGGNDNQELFFFFTGHKTLVPNANFFIMCSKCMQNKDEMPFVRLLVDYKNTA